MSSRVAIATDRDRFVGEAVGAVPLERLVEHVEAYASEQGTPIALDLDGGRGARGSVDVVEPGCEMLIASARDWLETRGCHGPARARACRVPEGVGARPDAARGRGAAADPSRSHAEAADRRAFAAVVAAELGATALVPDLVALAQCPHVLVAAVARQAARKLGAPRAKTGTLDELAPFLFDADRERLEVWANDVLAAVETGVT